MSKPEIALLERGYEIWNRGDIEAWLELADPEIEIQPTGLRPDFAAAYHGHQGCRDFWDAIRAGWEEFRIDVSRFIGVDDGVLVLCNLLGRTSDGIEVDIPLAHLYTFRDDLVVSFRAYPYWKDGIEAAGLDPSSLPAT